MGDRDPGSDANDRDHAEWARAVAGGYDELADAYDDQRDPTAEVPLVESLVADLSRGDRVLDAGCGGGRAVLETLAGGPGSPADGFETARARLFTGAARPRPRAGPDDCSRAR